MKKSFDYEEHGGTPLLGVNGIITKCHGSSNDKAIVFNDVILTNDKSSLEADKIEYNFISNQYRVSMFKKNEKVNIKLVEWVT